MGIIKQGILGGFSGKVGSVVGTSWKGRAVMKAMPLSVANPRTSGQVTQRNKMTACVSLAKSLLGGTIANMDNPFAGNISGYNRFVKRCISAFQDNGTLDGANLLTSEGALGGFEFDQMPNISAGSQNTNIQLDSIASPFNLSTDQIIVAVIDIDTLQVLNPGVVCGTRGSSSSVTVTVSFSTPPTASQRLGVYVSALRVDKKYVSTSVYAMDVV